MEGNSLDGCAALRPTNGQDLAGELSRTGFRGDRIDWVPLFI
jgi:hypothetical protein